MGISKYGYFLWVIFQLGSTSIQLCLISANSKYLLGKHPSSRQKLLNEEEKSNKVKSISTSYPFPFGYLLLFCIHTSHIVKYCDFRGQLAENLKFWPNFFWLKIGWNENFIMQMAYGDKNLFIFFLNLLFKNLTSQSKSLKKRRFYFF